ncbi:shikimate dehydrogenase [Buchnera aphidicola]|uniref:shikimate dehydrogenase n=1 Tax=Buchnera aphidicola TaxID=9 RepID=UPI0030EC1FBF
MNKLNFKNYFAVFGNPISHSKSPIIHKYFSKKSNINSRYIKLLSSTKTFYWDLIKFFYRFGLGANITLPFKEKAFNLCDKLTKRAKLSESVNTLKKLKNNLILGDNTDGIGLISDLKSYNFTYNNKNLLLLGAGGASKGVIPDLLKDKFNIFILNRTFKNALLLEKKYKKLGLIKAISYDFIKKNFFGIIINATSLSILNKIPNLPNFIISKNIICYDMFYQKKDTIFLKWCKNLGARYTFDGLGMLIHQAAHSFFLWHGIFPNIKKNFLSLKKKIFL